MKSKKVGCPLNVSSRYFFGKHKSIVTDAFKLDMYRIKG